MIFFPPCKINIGLDITGKRSDCFHDIVTLMLPVPGLCDILEIVPAEGNGVEFSVSGIPVECPPGSNLCEKAYRLVAERYDGVKGVKMHLHKMVPSGAGLGGGSSDAAWVIRGLDKLFGLGMDEQQMAGIAARLGSDVPFFLKDEPQMATGRGEILTPFAVPQLRGMKLVIVKPPVDISTAEAYAGITPCVPQTALAERLREDITAWRGTVVNAFESHIFEKYPQLKEIKQRLYDLEAVYASMSGSGSAVYGIFDAGKDIPTDTFADYFVYQQVI